MELSVAMEIVFVELRLFNNFVCECDCVSVAL